MKQYTASHEEKVFRKLENEPLPAASVSSSYSTPAKKRDYSGDTFHIGQIRDDYESELRIL